MSLRRTTTSSGRRNRGCGEARPRAAWRTADPRSLLATAATRWTSVGRLRIPSVVRHVSETGVQAIPIVAVIAFLISVISAYIGAQQLQPFGAEIFTVELVAIGVLRELGVLPTAIMVAGRSGSAYAAELGDAPVTRAAGLWLAAVI